MKRPTYGLIGRGRVATHLARYLRLESQPCIGWHRRMAADPVASLDVADTILLAISDDALEPFLFEHPMLLDRPVVHFSGSVALDGIIGLHPLMTFGPEPYGLETYREIPFVGEEGGPGFQDVFPELRNPSFVIAAEDKPLYHALCVLAGNFTTLLWSKAFKDFEERLGLPRRVLEPFLRRTASNTIASGREALTGSLARGDVATIKRDLNALDDDPYGEVYRAFAEAFSLKEVAR